MRIGRRESLGLVAALAAAEPATALVVRGGSMERPEWGMVGSWNGSSAVLIGERWAITARHAGGIPGDALSVRGRAFIADDVVSHPTADVSLIRVRGAFEAWHRVVTDPQPDERMVLGGFGQSAGAAIGSEGWAWGGPSRESWGENRLSATVNGLLAARFDLTDAAALQHESGLATGDSGGGFFVEGAGGTLLLAGVSVGVSVAGQTVNGATSYAVSLGALAPWIDSVIGAPVAGSRADAFVPAPGPAALAAMAAVCGARRRR